MTRTATILAIGTELTDGQIVNSNAARISSWLFDLGFEVRFHLAVPDSKPAMLSALASCAHAGDDIFVTGGLGPTSDDFTRNVVAEFVNVPLEFNESCWQRLQELFARRQAPMAMTNRQQCYFPSGSQILSNSVGTADAFVCSFRGKTIWVLPGPPDEIEAIWFDHVAAMLAGRVPQDERVRVHIRSCLGISEAALGEKISVAMAGCPYPIGYRAHSPLIDVKIWIANSASETAKMWLDKLEEATSEWLVSRDGADLGADFLAAIPRGLAVDIHDVATGGIIGQRLSTLITTRKAERDAERFSLVTQWEKPIDFRAWGLDVLKLADPAALTFIVCGISGRGEWAIGYGCGGEARVDAYTLSLKGESLKLRGARHVAELAFIKWRQFLAGQA